MTKTATDLLAEAKALDENERARLAGLLLESLEYETDSDAEAAWEKEVSARVEQIDSGEIALIPWEEVKRRLFSEKAQSS